MGERRIVQSFTMPLAHSRGAVIEVEITEEAPPGRARTRMALSLIRLAAKLVRMRVRIVEHTPLSSSFTQIR